MLPLAAHLVHRLRHPDGVVLRVRVRVVDGGSAAHDVLAPRVGRLLAVVVPRPLEVVLLVDVVGHADADVGERAARAVDGLAVLILDDRAVHEAERVLQLRQPRLEGGPLLARLLGVVLAAWQHLAVVPRGEGVLDLLSATRCQRGEGSRWVQTVCWSSPRRS